MSTSKAPLLGPAVRTAPIQYDTLADFTAAGGATAYGVGPVWIAGQQHWCNGASLSKGNFLLPSGGDDTSAMLENYNANGGVLLLGPGDFYMSPITLESSKAWGWGYGDELGPVIQGQGKNATRIFMKTNSISNTHTRYTVTAVTFGASTQLIISNHGIADGTLAILQFPTYYNTSGNTSERLNGKRFYTKSLNENTIQLYDNQSLTTATNSTGLGSFPSDPANYPVYLRTYAGVTTSNYTSCIRITGRNSGEALPLIGVTLKGFSLIAQSTSYGDYYDPQGIGIAVEAVGVGIYGKNSSSNQGLNIADVRVDGFDAAFLLDDCTNNLFLGCELEGNNYALWSAFNVDITHWLECRFGASNPIKGAPLQHVSVQSPILYRPFDNVTNVGYAKSMETFESCWFMACHGISLFNNCSGSYPSAIGSDGNAANTIVIKSCYAERVRQLVDVNVNLVVDGLHIGNYASDKSLHSSQCTFDNSGGGGGFVAQASFKNVIAETASDTPTIGFVKVVDQSNTMDKVNAITSFENCQIPGNIIKNGLNLVINLSGGHYSDDYRLHWGRLVFEGSFQIDGRQTTHRQTTLSGTVKPYLFSQGYHHIWIGINGALTVANPGTQSIYTSDTFLVNFFTAGFLSTPALRMLPISFTFSQDATGGRVVSFGTDYVLNAANTYSGASNTAARIEFKLIGSKFVQISPPMTWN